MKDFNPLTDKERKVIDEVVAKFRATPQIPCTACRYCVADCPQKINIPGIIGVFNRYKMFKNINNEKGSYLWAVGEGGKACDCISCGACESRCPQHIKISENLGEFSSLID